MQWAWRGEGTPLRPSFLPAPGCESVGVSFGRKERVEVRVRSIYVGAMARVGELHTRTEIFIIVTCPCTSP